MKIIVNLDSKYGPNSKYYLVKTRAKYKGKLVTITLPFTKNEIKRACERRSRVLNIPGLIKTKHDNLKISSTK